MVEYLCTASIIACPTQGVKHSQMVRQARVGPTYFRWGQLEYLLDYWQCFGNYTLRVLAVLQGPVLRTVPALPSSSGVDAAGTAWTRVVYLSYSQYS